MPNSLDVLSTFARKLNTLNIPYVLTHYAQVSVLEFGAHLVATTNAGLIMHYDRTAEAPLQRGRFIPAHELSTLLV